MNDTQLVVLRAVHEHPGAMSALFLSHLLRGNIFGRMAEKGVAESSHRGALAHLTPVEVDTAIAGAVEAGLLKRVAGPYASLVTTRGGEALVSRQHMPPPVEGSTTVSPDVAYKAYYAWRQGEARSKRTIPYRVLTNRILNEIARIQPVTLGELLLVPGLGKLRAMRYQDGLLAIGQQLRGVTPAAAGQ
jgi:hypothetical protein